jgi:hypothetical protein
MAGILFVLHVGPFHHALNLAFAYLPIVYAIAALRS